MASQRTKYVREAEQIEKLEQEHFKRMNFTKKEMKERRNKAKEEVQDRLDRMDDLKGLESILGGGNKRKNGDRDDDIV